MKSRHVLSRVAPGCVAAVAVAVVAGLAAGEARAQAAARPDPDHCTVALSFEEFFAADKRGTARPMKLYVVRREGKFLHALGSSPTWNVSTHTVEALDVEYADGRLRGKLAVTLWNDPWVPDDYKPAKAELEIDARLDLGDPGREGSIDGRYQGTLGGKAVSGRLGGRLMAPEVTGPEAARYAFRVMDVFEGGGNTWDRSAHVEFDVFDGRPETEGRWGQADMRGNPKSLEPVEFKTLEVTEHAFTAECELPFEILGAVKDARATYHLKIDALRVNDLIGGVVTVTVARENHKPVVKRSGFKGWVRPAERAARSIWDDARRRDDRPWWAPTKGFKPVQPGEHPRLFFRKDDLPELRRRAETPLGKQLVERLRATLGGGEAMPEHRSKADRAYANLRENLPEGAYTISHVAGFGMLYQLTGDKKYADLGRKCMELALAGQRDRDDRYSWMAPGGELRAGPTLAWYALGYDLCYDGWDESFRRRIARAIQDYDDGKAGEWGKPEGVSLHQMALSPKQTPSSNHYGAVVGGSGIAVLAIRGDPGTDDARLGRYLDKIEENLVIALTRGLGDHGYFSENAGPSHVAAHTALVSFLAAMKTAGGKDYIAPRPNGRWMTLRWAMELVPGENGRPYYPCRKPSNYGGPDFLAGSGGMSHGGWFAEGFGAIRPEEKPALLWVYENFVAETDQHRFTASNYPHRAVLALVHWPINVPPKNPADVLPRAVVDTIHGYYVFRNRWKDKDDVLVTMLMGSGPRGHMGSMPTDVTVWGLGEKLRFGRFGHMSQTTYYQSAPSGSGVAAGTCGNCLAVDFSKASGADALLVMVGPGAEGGQTARAGGTTFHVLTLQQGEAPKVRAEGDTLRIGNQTVRYDGEKLILGRL
jgi:hypothetical protein